MDTDFLILISDLDFVHFVHTIIEENTIKKNIKIDLYMGIRNLKCVYAVGKGWNGTWGKGKIIVLQFFCYLIDQKIRASIQVFRDNTSIVFFGNIDIASETIYHIATGEPYPSRMVVSKEELKFEENTMMGVSQKMIHEK